MTIADYATNNLPDNYYTTMYMDGYSPEEIMMTAHRTFYDEAMEREEIDGVSITSEVKLKR